VDVEPMTVLLTVWIYLHHLFPHLLSESSVVERSLSPELSGCSEILVD
jgi:hypothetical protein